LLCISEKYVTTKYDVHIKTPTIIKLAKLTFADKIANVKRAVRDTRKT